MPIAAARLEFKRVAGREMGRAGMRPLLLLGGDATIAAARREVKRVAGARWEEGRRRGRCCCSTEEPGPREIWRSAVAR
jgi:hypothetical protein